MDSESIRKYINIISESITLTKTGLSQVNKEVPVNEKWDAEMKTAEKDIGKWEGYSVADLKKRKKRLMDKESRSAAEQKEVKQINFAIRAKTGWGKIKE